jgi:RNA recognition motif-containing protein
MDRERATKEEPTMAGTRVYVGNLAFSTSTEALKQAFQQGGRQVVEVKIVTDRDTGQPRGFAFVEMASPADAQAVIAQWDGQDLDGRALKVNEARERTGGGGGGGRGDGGGGGGRRGGY